MRKVLITGAAGFIGSTLAEACIGRGLEVVAVDSFAPYYSESVKRRNIEGLLDTDACAFIEGDLAVIDLSELLDGIDTVFHLAAQAGVRPSWGEQFDWYTTANITVTQRLLEAAKGSDIAKFVFVSSSSVYGDAESLPTPEDSVLQPVSPYGATKALGEHLMHVYWKAFQVPSVIVRYFSVYGPRQRPDMAFHRLINAALAGEEFTIYGDGEQTRDFTFVADTVEGTIAAALKGEPGRIYNIGGGTRVSMNEVVDRIGALAERPVDLVRSSRQRGDARHTAADISRARDELGFSASHSLDQGLLAQIEWQRAELELLTPSH